MLALFAFLLLLMAPVVTGYVIVQPLNDHLRGNKKAIRKFTLLDFLVLAVFLQVFFAACVAVRKRFEDGRPEILLLIAICCFVGLLALWWAGVEAATRANANDTKRRLAIHLLLLPGTVCMMLLTSVSIFAVVEHLSYSNESPFSDAGGGWIMVLLVIGGTAAGTLLLRGLARWLARTAGPPLKQQPLP
jgi:hypothetical protein